MHPLVQGILYLLVLHIPSTILFWMSWGPIFVTSLLCWADYVITLAINVITWAFLFGFFFSMVKAPAYRYFRHWWLQKLDAVPQENYLSFQKNARHEYYSLYGQYHVCMTCLKESGRVCSKILEEIHEVYKKTASWCEERKGFQRSLNACNSKLLKAKNQISNLRSRNIRLELENLTACNEIDLREEKLIAATSELTKMQARIKMLEDKLVARSRELSQAQSKVEKLQTRIDDVEVELIQRSLALRKAETDIHNLEKQLSL